jgi:hypothetical protein
VLDHPCGRHRLVGKVLTGLLSLMLLAAGAGKFFAPVPADAPFVLAPSVLYTLAVIDILLAIGLWLPRVSTLSYVLTVGYFGGATATNLTHAQPAGMTAFPAALIVFTLLAAYFRAPELFLRAMGKESLDEGEACAVPKRS